MTRVQRMCGCKHSPVLPAIAMTAALFMLSCGRQGPVPPPDQTPPRVSATIPANGSSNVPVDLNGGVVITFSEKMDPSTIDNQTIMLVEDQNSITGSVSYADANGVPNAVLTPSSNLKPATLYHINIAAGVKDVAGNAMDAPYVCTFYTGTVPDATPPTIESSDPSQGDVTVVPTTAIGISFSEPVVPVTIVFSLSTGSTTVPCNMSYTGTTATFTPLSVLAFNTAYTAIVDAGVRDLAGNPMQNNYVWNFTTIMGAPDTIPPVVTAATPTGGTTGVAVNVSPGVTFSEPVEPATIAFTLSTGSTTILCGMNYSGTIATFTPFTALALNTLYTATVSSGVKDLSGNPMQNDYVWSFITSTALDTVPPAVAAVVPAIGAINIIDRPMISITFTEAVDPATITFTLTAGTSTATCPLLYSGVTATCTPSSPLKHGTLYTAWIKSGVEDLAGNAMPSDYFWSFKTK
jgi:hypothetical protein